MTSRERVLMALNHQEPDRVPIDIGSTANNFTKGLFEKLIEHFEIKVPSFVPRPDESAPYYNDELVKCLGGDFRHIFVYPPSTADFSVRANGTTINEWGFVKKEIGGMRQQMGNPLSEAETPADVLAYNWPDPDDEARYKGVKERAKYLYNNTDCAIAARAVSHGIFELSLELLGMENLMMDMAIGGELTNVLMDKVLDIQCKIYENYLRECGKYVHVVQTADDYGTQNGLMISPDMFRLYIKPRRTKLNRLIKKYAPNAKILHHTCGSVFDLMDDLIDCGIDILNPVQPFAAKMDSFELKKHFGSRICFHGGIDEQYAFPTGKEAIENEVRLRIRAFAPGGGYIIGPTSNIQDDTSVETVLHYLEKAAEYGKYPISLP